MTDAAGPSEAVELVHAAVDGAVATLTLDSPRNRNALSSLLVAQLSERLREADADPAVRVIVIAASGPAFCSGADLAQARAGGMEQGAAALVALQREILSVGVPVVVRLHAPVRAGGLGIVGAADVVIAATSVSFAFTEVRLGLAPLAISLTTLPRLTSRGAAEAFLSGSTFSAHDAQAMGLVTRAVPDEDLDEAVAEVSEALAQGVAQGQRETKALLNAPLIETIDRLGPSLAARSATLFGSDEARAAMQAFLHRSASGSGVRAP